MGVVSQQPVWLRIYDISRGKAAFWSNFILGQRIEGIWHTGVHVFGMEYFYGSGLECMSPADVERNFEMEIVEEQLLGYTSRSRKEFDAFVDSLDMYFTPATYDLLKWNCNHFSELCSRFLLDGRGIPDEILDLPDAIRSTFMGGFILRFMEQFRGRGRGASGSVRRGPRYVNPLKLNPAAAVGRGRFGRNTVASAADPVILSSDIDSPRHPRNLLMRRPSTRRSIVTGRYLTPPPPSRSPNRRRSSLSSAAGLEPGSAPPAFDGRAAPVRLKVPPAWALSSLRRERSAPHARGPAVAAALAAGLSVPGVCRRRATASTPPPLRAARAPPRSSPALLAPPAASSPRSDYSAEGSDFGLQLSSRSGRRGSASWDRSSVCVSEEGEGWGARRAASASRARPAAGGGGVPGGPRPGVALLGLPFSGRRRPPRGGPHISLVGCNGTEAVHDYPG